MTSEELKAAYKVALDDVATKQAAVDAANAAASAARADLRESQQAADELLVLIKEAIVAETL